MKVYTFEKIALPIWLDWVTVIRYIDIKLG